jgi:hypothetical protein
LPIAWALVAIQPITGSAATTASAACAGWNSFTRPPDSIRVLRRKSGRVETVPFRKYVITVMGKEWPSYLPQPVVEAGAVAVKQYAWYHAAYSARNTADGRCYDVRDGVTDQLYKPGRARVSSDHYRAVDATWAVTIQKDGRFIMTGYRRGEKVRCGRDATGYKLFAMSATNCARKGYSWRQILRVYYGSGANLVGDGNNLAAGEAEADTALPPATVPLPPETSVAPPEQPLVPASVETGGIGGSTTGGLGVTIAPADVAPGSFLLELLRLASLSIA